MIARQYWVKDYGARAKSRHVLCREAGDECYIYAKYLEYSPIWRQTYLIHPKVSIDSTKYFRKYNFRNDHVVSYENYENFLLRKFGAIRYKVAIFTYV